MNKKKSKSQKQRRNNRKKLIAMQEVKNEELKNKTKEKSSKKPQLIDKNKVKYNVVLKSKKNEFQDLKASKKTTKKNIKKKYKNNQPPKDHIIKRIFLFIKNNIHILFNSVLILLFFILSLGLFVTEIFSKKINIYIISILIFFMLIAISYNKYISGKLFTIILCVGMGFGIYSMNYTYDYINCLNSSYYEAKTYYVITFDNNTNKNIYNLSNKSIGLLSNNHTNVEKILNIKLDSAKYEVYEDINLLYNDFFAEKTRAIIVNENQYYYLLNNIENKNRTIKILFEFNANSNK